jgi:hypothetical protein
VNGCQKANCSITACGENPNRKVIAGPTIRFSTNTTTLMMIRILTAGVMPPGPNA